MANVNRVLLVGNLTFEPDLRYTTGGAAICALRLATNRRFRTASGEQREETCYVDIDVFGNQAEPCGRYLKKGSQVYIEGRLHLDQWQDRQTNENRSKLKVVAESVQFLDAKPDQASPRNARVRDGSTAGYRDDDPGQGAGGHDRQGGARESDDHGNRGNSSRARNDDDMPTEAPNPF